MSIDHSYQQLIAKVCRDGDLVTARNAQTRRVFDADPISFSTTPLITVRKTAWRLAIREMEWFLSGIDRCPESTRPAPDDDDIPGLTGIRKTGKLFGAIHTTSVSGPAPESQRSGPKTYRPSLTDTRGGR